MIIYAILHSGGQEYFLPSITPLEPRPNDGLVTRFVGVDVDSARVVDGREAYAAPQEITVPFNGFSIQYIPKREIETT